MFFFINLKLHLYIKYKPINIIYKWKLDDITFPTKKQWSDFIDPIKRYDKI